MISYLSESRDHDYHPSMENSGVDGKDVIVVDYDSCHYFFEIDKIATEKEIKEVVMKHFDNVSVFKLELIKDSAPYHWAKQFGSRSYWLKETEELK